MHGNVHGKDPVRTQMRYFVKKSKLKELGVYPSSLHWIMQQDSEHDWNPKKQWKNSKRLAVAEIPLL